MCGLESSVCLDEVKVELKWKDYLGKASVKRERCLNLNTERSKIVSRAFMMEAEWYDEIEEPWNKRSDGSKVRF